MDTTSSSSSSNITQVRAEVTRRIKALGRAGKPREAVTQLAEMARLGVQPDMLAATALVDACARNGKMEMAQSVFDELFGEFLKPDDVAFAVLVRGYGDMDPPRWSSISGLLNLMDRQFGLAPTTVIYNVLLDICARTNDEERGFEVIRRMEAAGVEPDDMTEMAVKNRKSLRSYLRKAFAAGPSAGVASADEDDL